jgi:hypothetical protein
MAADDNEADDRPFMDTTRFDGALRLHDWGVIRAAGADAAASCTAS